MIGVFEQNRTVLLPNRPGVANFARDINVTFESVEPLNLVDKLTSHGSVYFTLLRGLRDISSWQLGAR